MKTFASVILLPMFSSTAGGIVPVVKLDGRMIGNGRPGAVTRMIRKRYWSLLENGEMSCAVYD
jgi:branched-subunit amino acid aminotransferase/4-amino-4-deoxychorismate lyase